MKETILNLYAIGAIKFGNFEIKKDFLSPFQVDLQGLISRPQVAKEVCNLIWEKVMHLSFDLLCGVPPLASCFANFIAWEQDLPLIAYHEKKIVGIYKSDQKCLLLQGLDVTGSSTLDMIDALEEEGVVIREILTFLDMGFGAKKKIKSRGYVYHSVLSMSEVIQILYESGKLAGDNYKLACDFLENA